MQGTFTTGCLGQPIMTKPKKHYVVWAGRVPGVFQTWDDCKAQVDGFSGQRRSHLPVGHAPQRQARLPQRSRGLPPLQVRCPWPLSPWTLGECLIPQAQ